MSRKMPLAPSTTLLALAVVVSGCGSELVGDAPQAPAAIDPLLAADANQPSHFTPADLLYDEEDVVQIFLEGTSASADSSAVTIDGSTVTIIDAGVYAISGRLSDGALVVEANDDDHVILLLNGVDVTNSRGSALAALSADEVVVILAEGSRNQFTDGEAYVFPDAETDEPNAALYSAADLTLAGTGELTVTGNFNDGIASKDGLVIVSGILDVVAIDDGVRGKDYVIVDGGTLRIGAGGDGIKSDNDEDLERGFVEVTGGTFDITAGDDGIQCATDVLIFGGSFTVDAGFDSDTGRGIQGDIMVVVADGTIEASAVDDAIHSNGEVRITGGDLRLASGDDGVHGDFLVTIDGGSVTIAEAFEGIEAEYIVINDGFIDITSNDDGLNVASAEATSVETGPGGGPGAPNEVTGDYTIYLNGGTTTITVTGELDEQGDGIDANGHVRMTGGIVTISGPTDTRNSAVDYGTFTISGGLFIGTNINGRNSQGIGAGSSQAALYVTLDSTADAGETIHIESAAGESLVTFAPANPYDVIVFSSPDLVEGEAYNIYLGGSVEGESPSHLYEDSAYAAGALESSVTASL